MKNILKFIVSLLILLAVSKVKAYELNYSEWSMLYPSGLDETFIETEERYRWYKVENNLIEYSEDYYTELDGYIKDVASKKNYYRYITNNLVFNANNDLILDTNYCKKNFCYVKTFVEPTMVDLSAKDTESLYEEASLYEISSEVSPATGDAIVYSFLVFGISLLTILLIVIKSKRKVSSE